MKTINKSFLDKLSWNPTEKTAISVRDGFLEYYGAELGVKPYEKVFKVYRSPATIANVARAMEGIPITNDHVEVTKTVENKVGVVDKSEMIDLKDIAYNSNLAVKNKLFIDNLEVLDSIGNRELSLGYSADLVSHDEYDFEQKNIEPHHLAIVKSGRCGSECSFLDKKEVLNMGKQIIKKFKDQEGDISLEDVANIIRELEDAIKKVPLDKLQEAMPVFLSLISIANGEEMTEKEMEEDSSTEADTVEDITETILEDEDMEEEKKVKLTDSKAFKDALSKALNSKLEVSMKNHTYVIQKAQDFLDSSYNFVDKTTKQIMRDTLNVQYGSQKFSESELPLAFKMLKKASKSDEIKFADSKKALLDKIANQEI